MRSQIRTESISITLTADDEHSHSSGIWRGNSSSPLLEATLPQSGSITLKVGKGFEGTVRPNSRSDLQHSSKGDNEWGFRWSAAAIARGHGSAQLTLKHQNNLFGEVFIVVIMDDRAEFCGDCDVHFLVRLARRVRASFRILSYWPGRIPTTTAIRLLR